MKLLYTILVLSFFLITSCEKEDDSDDNEGTNTSVNNQGKVKRFHNYGDNYSIEFKYNEKGLLVEEWRTQSGITYLNIKIKYDINDKIVELIETRGGYTDIYTYERTSLDTLKIHYYENSVNQLNYKYSQVFIGQENQPDSSYTINDGSSRSNHYIWKDGNLISWTKDGATSFFEYDNFKNPFLGTFSTPGIGSEIHTGQIGLLLSTNNRIKTTRSESVITFTCKYENDFPLQFYSGEELIGEFEFY